MLPDIIEEIDYETLKRDTLTYLSPFIPDVSLLESDTAMLIIEALLYREILLRARINASVRASYLFTATASDLDAVAYGYGVNRLEGEGDEALRNRCVLSLYRFSTAGSRGSYVYWTKSVSSSIGKVKILTPTAGVIEIVYDADTDFNTDIEAVCSDENVRPLCDTVIVTRASRSMKDIVLSITLLDGVSLIQTRNAIVQAFGSLSLGIGVDLPLSTIFSTASVTGVYKVVIMNLSDDIVADDRTIIIPNIIFN